MEPSTNDEIRCMLHKLKGKAKQQAGEVLGNPDLEAEGQGEQLAGTAQRKVGQIEKGFE